MKGHDIVVAALGGFPKEGEAYSLFSDTAKGYVPAMVECGIKRFFTIFGAGFLGEKVA
jgi:hypothetical protein